LITWIARLAARVARFVTGLTFMIIISAIYWIFMIIV
jgi:hypothetical protein